MREGWAAGFVVGSSQLTDSGRWGTRKCQQTAHMFWGILGSHLSSRRASSLQSSLPSGHSSAHTLPDHPDPCLAPQWHPGSPACADPHPPTMLYVGDPRRHLATVGETLPVQWAPWVAPSCRGCGAVQRAILQASFVGCLPSSGATRGREGGCGGAKMDLGVGKFGKRLTPLCGSSEDHRLLVG